MYIGFNLQKADDLVEAIVRDYNSLGQYTSQEWETLKNVLRREWIGPDEQAFEAEFVKRLCDLNIKAYDLAKTCTQTIGNTADKWHTFQKNNNINGGTVASVVSDVGRIIDKLIDYARGGAPQLKKNASIIVFKPRTDLGNNINRGLKIVQVKRQFKLLFQNSLRLCKHVLKNYLILFKQIKLFMVTKLIY